MKERNLGEGCQEGKGREGHKKNLGRGGNYRIGTIRVGSEPDSRNAPTFPA